MWHFKINILYYTNLSINYANCIIIILFFMVIFHTSQKWTQFVCRVANFYCVTCHDLRPSRMDDVDFFKIK
jgi:hypothetical protein